MSKNSKQTDAEASQKNDPSSSASSADSKEQKQDAAAPKENASIETLQQDLEKFRDLALRSQADLANFRKRMTREREDAVRYANASLVEELLPVIDNFELGLDAAKKSEEAKNITVGFEMVLRQIHDFLRSQHVETIDAEGAVFDPNLHDAVAQEASEEAPEGTVLKQVRKGYKLRDRLIRPAAVVVSKGKAVDSQ